MAGPAKSHVLVLVRHAIALDREQWTGDDALRPLTPAGRAQARHIADDLARLIDLDRVAALRTSPAVRCVQTIEPLAQRLGRGPTIEARLMEGSDIQPPAPDQIGVHIICAHGDNIPWLLDDLKIDWDGRCKKGSIWLITRESDGRVREATYHRVAKE